MQCEVLTFQDRLLTYIMGVTTILDEADTVSALGPIGLALRYPGLKRIDLTFLNSHSRAHITIGRSTRVGYTYPRYA
jgi:hypothetical protein